MSWAAPGRSDREGSREVADDGAEFAGLLMKLRLRNWLKEKMAR
jgi:hypothetical protein